MPTFQEAVHGIMNRSLRASLEKLRGATPGISRGTGAPGAHQPIPLDPNTGWPDEGDEDSDDGVFLAGDIVGDKPVG